MASQPKSKQDLQKLEQWLRHVFQINLLDAMTPSRRASIGSVRLEAPTEFPREYNVDPGFPLQICADLSGRAVICPIKTVIWLDEYAGTWAWLHKTRGNEAVILLMIFAAMIVADRRTSSPPGPFETFHLTASIYEDDFTKDVSNKCLNGAICFLLLHELGHLALNHVAPSSTAASQEQERAADAYALDAMAELHILSLGVPALFFAAAAMELGPATHPLSGARIAAIAARLETESYRFVDRLDPHPDWTAGKLREHGAALRILVVPKLTDPAERTKFIDLATRYSFEDLRQIA